MGRSVSYPHNAVAVAYSVIEIEDAEDIEAAQWAYDDMKEDLEQYAPTLWPSLTKCEKWIGREDIAVLENAHCYMGISEYCGLVARWIVPKTDEYGYYPEANLCATWCEQIADKFSDTFGSLRRIGTFSNGETFFERKE